MTDIVLNPSIQNYIDRYFTDPVQGILINGPKGAGKGYIANYIASNFPGSKNDRIHSVVPLEDKKTIGIDQIKIVISRLRTKQDKRLFIIIEDADIMTLEAQNILLKALEEPPVNVSFILTTSRINDVLPTIKSRVSQWQWLPPGTDQINKYISDFGFDNKSNYISIARGRMGLLHALVTDQASHPLVLALDKAKDLLAASISKRLLLVDELSKDILNRVVFMDALVLISQVALDASVKKGNYRDWLIRVTAINDALGQLDKNIQPKLVLTRLFLVL